MRTTIDLPENLHRIASAIARETGRSLSETVAELLERGLSAQVAVAEGREVYRLDQVTGLPSVCSQRPITADDVRALDEEP